LLGAGVFILAAQAILSQVVRREPFLPSPPPFSEFPIRVGPWAQTQEIPLEPEVLEMLGPDDTLNREYQLAGGLQRASLFVAYYKTQLRGKNAHDPKVCLPGAGWNPRMSRVMDIALPGSGHVFPVNYYRIAREDSEAVVLYWFQTPDGVYTFEQQLKAHRMFDAIVHNRTDMALVRIVAPVDQGGVGAADASAIQLAQLIYTQMLPYFPSKENNGS